MSLSFIFSETKHSYILLNAMLFFFFSGHEGRKEFNNSAHTLYTLKGISTLFSVFMFVTCVPLTIMAKLYRDSLELLIE